MKIPAIILLALSCSVCAADLYVAPGGNDTGPGTLAKPSKHETNPLVQPEVDPEIKLAEKPDGVILRMTLDRVWVSRKRHLLTSALLGKAKPPNLPYEQPDGSPYRIDTDYFGNKRNTAHPCAGPFEHKGQGRLELKVW